MKRKTKKRLAELFREMESRFEDHKSTEFLLEVTAQEARERGIYPDCDSGDVAEALL